MADVVNRLRELRKQSKKSKAIVADFIGISQPRISSFEKGESIPSEYLVLLADFFDVSTDYILCRTDNKKTVPCENITEDEYGWIMLLRSLSPEQKKVVDGMRTGICAAVRQKD